jgi:hypothetical protein
MSFSSLPKPYRFVNVIGNRLGYSLIAVSSPFVIIVEAWDLRIRQQHLPVLLAALLSDFFCYFIIF